MGGGTTPIIKRNVIKGNDASRGQGGGGIWMNDVEALIVQNLITGNKASAGAGIHSTVTDSVIVNNTIADNDAASEGSGIFARGHHGVQLINNIIAAKPGQTGFHCVQFFGENSPTTRFNNIFSAGGMAYGGSCLNKIGTDGNISADPQFTNPAQGDYHLQLWSPSIDAGDNQAPDLPDTDLDGDPRILDGDGNGTATIDMGVDEFLLPLGLKISLMDESNPSSNNSRALFICDLRPWARTPGRRPKDPVLRQPGKPRPPHNQEIVLSGSLIAGGSGYRYLTNISLLPRSL